MNASRVEYDYSVMKRELRVRSRFEGGAPDTLARTPGMPPFAPIFLASTYVLDRGQEFRG
jgi:hypothetical protein